MKDPRFFYFIQVDSESRLTDTFGADDKSRMDYACFGDVIGFDTTNKTNKYSLPFATLWELIITAKQFY